MSFGFPIPRGCAREQPGPEQRDATRHDGDSAMREASIPDAPIYSNDAGHRAFDLRIKATPM